MKTHILTALWQRPEITRICFEGIKRLGLSATASISEESYIKTCEEYGIDWVMTPNQPVGHKWNAGMIQALNHKWDYVMILGSDDIVTNSIFDIYKPLMGVYFMFGVDSCYFYHKGKIKRFSYKDKSTMSVGAGRMLHRSLVEDCMPLWGDVNRSLDGSCLKRIRSKGYDEKVVSLGDAVIMDIKSDTNLNHFSRLEGDFVNATILDFFSYKERMLLRDL